MGHNLPVMITLFHNNDQNGSILFINSLVCPCVRPSVEVPILGFGTSTDRTSSSCFFFFFSCSFHGNNCRRRCCHCSVLPPPLQFVPPPSPLQVPPLYYKVHQISLLPLLSVPTAGASSSSSSSWLSPPSCVSSLNARLPGMFIAL